jgi:hypothetical protein
MPQHFTGYRRIPAAWFAYQLPTISAGFVDRAREVTIAAVGSGFRPS